MSGILPEQGRGDLMLQRYQEMLKNDTNKTFVAPSTVGSVCESAFPGQSLNNTTLQSNKGTLATQQFYQQNSNAESSQFGADKAPLKPPSVLSSSTFRYTSASDACFKMPYPVKNANNWPQVERKLEIMSAALRQIENWKTLKFVLKGMETFVYSGVRHHTHNQPTDPIHLVQQIADTIKEEYQSKRILKSNCSTSSITSEQPSNFGPFGTNLEPSILMERLPVSSFTSGPRGAMTSSSGMSNRNRQLGSQEMYCSSGRVAQHRDRQHFDKQLELVSAHAASNNRSRIDQFMETVSENQSQVNLFNDSFIPQGRDRVLRCNTATSLSEQQYELSSANITSNKRARTAQSGSGQQPMANMSENESPLLLFDDSVIAQQRDEAVMKQSSGNSSAARLSKENRKTQAKPTPKPKVVKSSQRANNKHSKKPDTFTQDSNCNGSNNNNTTMDGTVVGVSKRGRPLKLPAKYWKGDDTENNGTVMYSENIEPLLNESMTLRNNKVLDKNKTVPKKGSANNTPLTSISENKIAETGAKKQPKEKWSNKIGKENSGLQIKNRVKKQNETTVTKEISSKAKANKKKGETINQDKQKITKKPAPKRKSKEPSELASKKKKIEEDTAACNVSSDIDEDLFGGVNYKKPTNRGLQMALSPSCGLLSAKKAAGVPLGKATPPCKAFGEFMDNSIQSVMSSVKEAPVAKKNNAVKRVIKNIERDQKNPQTKQQKQKTQDKRLKNQDKELDKMLFDAVQSSYSVTTPVSTATLTFFRGQEPESDPEDSDIENDDDDLI